MVAALKSNKNGFEFRFVFQGSELLAEQKMIVTNFFFQIGLVFSTEKFQSKTFLKAGGWVFFFDFQKSILFLKNFSPLIENLCPK